MSEFTPHDAIYLQVGDSDEPIRIDETTWCSDKINDGDVKYLLATPEREAAPEMYKELEQAKDALERCGIGGIYDNFHSLSDAIIQMSLYIKNLEREKDEWAEVKSEMYEALCFARSVIKSGEEWTDTCEKIINGAIALANKGVSSYGGFDTVCGSCGGAGTIGDQLCYNCEGVGYGELR